MIGRFHFLILLIMIFSVDPSCSDYSSFFFLFQFYVYEFPDDSEEEEIMVTVTSDSEVCALVSVQDGLVSE